MSRIAYFAAAVVLFTGFEASGARIAPDAMAAEAEADINRALRGRAYQRAVELIDAALPDAKPASREGLLFRRGLALLYDDQATEAVAQFTRQIEQFPDGPWANKARFRMADAHVLLKQYDTAEQIYAARVRVLVGDERKARIAHVYLDFAKEFFEPRDSLVKPDYAKARTFYERALELEPGEVLRDDILFRRALCNQKLTQWSDAITQYEHYLLTFDEAFRSLRKMRYVGAALPPAASQPGKHVIEARLALAESRLASGHHADARRDLHDLLALLGKMDPAGNSDRATWIKATYLVSKTYLLPTPPDGESLTLGAGALERVLETFPEAKEAIQAAHDIGASYSHLGRHDEAIRAFRALIDRDVIRPVDDEARKLAETLSQDALFQIGRLYFAQKKYEDAIGVWNQYAAKYPTGPNWSAAQRAIVDTEYQIGEDAVAEDRYDDAREAWTAFLQRYPLDDRAARILYRFGELSYMEQKKREKASEEPNWSKPIAHWKKLVNKFPNTEESGHGQYMIGYILEHKIKDLEAAIEAYQKLTWSNWSSEAHDRLAEMRATKLRLLTERVYRTDERATVRVDLRNIDKLTVKLYRVDMEDYFRKSHSLRGVESLDLLLIDPDKTIEVPVEGFEKYKPVMQQIEIPVTEAGVWAVNVSNENATDPKGGRVEHRKIEATTLLIRSDIDVIVKSSRRQVFVFAEDMRKKTPAAGVRVLVSDGKKIVMEGKTGDDGVWHEPSDDLKNMENVSVFAEYEGHIAGDAVSLGGLGFSTGLQPRGYIYTDRPTYQPGQAVNIRGILREIKDGQYVPPTQPEDERLRWKLDVVDAKGRVLKTEGLSFTDYGSFASQFRIAADAPVGEYRLIARRVEGPTFSGSFDVRTYQLPKAYLSFDFTDRVLMRGTKISGSVVAKYHYGEPVVGKTIEYQMNLPTGDSLRRSGVTDQEGRVLFEFDSTILPEEGTVWFSARQADLDIGTSSQVFVAVRAFRATAKAIRPLYLSEEPVEVEIETKDLTDKPIAKEMTLTALLRTESDGEWAETKVETIEVKTDAETGTGRASLKLVKGGTYILRAEGKDRFDHVVSAEATVQVSDDKDKTRLRLFTDRQRYKVGETIGLDLHSRIDDAPRMRERILAPAGPPNGKPGGEGSGEGSGIGPADDAEDTFLVLITCEGEEVISYRTMRFSRGHNAFELPVDHEHFPNFAVGVAVMADNRFYTASRDFIVERKLNVTLTPDKTTYRPRDEMTVEIAVTDQQGKPVQAEIGLSMIDNALLTRFPDRTENIVAFFKAGAHRNAETRTRTSCTFRYQAQTRVMATEILAEARRLEEAEDLMTIPTFSGRNILLGDLGMRRRGRSAGEGGTRRGGRFLRGQSAEAPAPADARQKLYAGAEIQTYESDDFDAGGYRASVEVAFTMDRLIAPSDRIVIGRQLQQQVDELNKVAMLRPVSQLDIGPTTQTIAELVRGAPPRTYYPEVAYWNPHVETDADGKATVKIVLPDSSTKWKLIARGVTVETLPGRGEAEVTCKHDFVTEVLNPPIVVEGDTFQPLAQVHCMTPYTGKIDVTLSITPASDTGSDAAERHDATDTQTRTIEVAGSGVYDVAFDEIAVPDCDKLLVEVEAKTHEVVPDAGRKLTDAVARFVPVRPWGMRIEEHVAGTAKDTEFVEVLLPEGGEHHDLWLTVAVGSSMQRWLIEEALERGPRWAFIEKSLNSRRLVPPRTHADTASSLLACLYASDYLRAQQADGAGDGGADTRLLNERIAGLIAQLLSAQKDDGGWPWCGKDAAPDVWTTAQAAWAIGKARHDGHAVADEAAGKLLGYLKQEFAGARTGQTELKAVALHGISWLEEADYGHANRLYRNRQSLSTAALGHLALVYVRLDRKTIASELLSVLAERTKEISFGDNICREVSSRGNSAWMNSELEVTALALLAQLSVDARAAGVQPMVGYLVASARADGWHPHKAKGAILAALATYYARGEQERANYKLAISVNGENVRDLTSDDASSVRIDLGEEKLADGKQRVDFAFSGRGEFAYAVTLSGFSRSFPTPDATKNKFMRIGDRRVSPPPIEYKGRVVKTGFSIVEDFKRFHNEVRHLPVGAVADAFVWLQRYDKSENSAGDRDYIIVQETIPTGFRLLTDTIAGQHLAYDYSNGLLTLYYGSRKRPGNLRYKMVATIPGAYRMPPTVIRSLFRPDVIHVNKADRVVTVLPRDGESPDKYRMTPDELYALGRLHFEDEAYVEAAGFLKDLLAGKWVVKDEPYRESIRMLLDAALARDDADDIVDNFEILKEKYPGLVIPFEKIIRVADAYARTDQHERAYLIYRATADASFVRDANVGAVLQEEGRFLESIDFLENLWRDYPDTPQVESIYYALSQTLYEKAENPQSIQARRGPKGAVGRVTKAAIIAETIRLLEGFLALYPESPVADEASYSLANAYLDLDDFETVITRTTRMAELFPNSKWFDRFRYLQALAQFNLGNFDDALGLARQVTESTYRDEQGVVRPSPNKWLALYIIGQIYHAQQETEKAIEYYKKVKSRFSDAEEVVSYFEHKFVEMPEVAIFHPDQDGFREAIEWRGHLRGGANNGVAGGSRAGRPGGGPPGSLGGAGSERAGRPNIATHSAAKPAPRLYDKPFVEIAYRNVKTAVLQVYRVDLMKLALVEKNLTQITSVNLAGIKPIMEQTVSLGDGHDYVEKSTRVELDLSAMLTKPGEAAGGNGSGGNAGDGEGEGADANGHDGTGAYLVICRGDDLFASGLVLVTPLAVEVQEDTASQRARVNVVDAINRGGLKNVHVKVIGSEMSRFIDGDTDLRGVFVADSVAGYPTAIARDEGGRFAFYRSPSAVLAMAQPEPRQEDKKVGKGVQAKRGSKADYRSNLRDDNRAIQASNEMILNEIINRQQRGVQVQEAQQELVPQQRKK